MALVAVAVGAGLLVGVGVYAASRNRQDLPGLNLDEMQQTAKEGEPRVQVWGTVRPIRGNIVAAENPPRIVRRKQSGGKGGGTPRTEHPYRTYAIGVCEGPIAGFRRIWRNNKLVYDGRPGSVWGNTPQLTSWSPGGNFEFKTNNEIFLEQATLYYGTYEQIPSPVLEQVFGAGEVPAMRGTAYMVMSNEDLTDTNGAVPQWTFEVERAPPSPPGPSPLAASILKFPPGTTFGRFETETREVDGGTAGVTGPSISNPGGGVYVGVGSSVFGSNSGDEYLFSAQSGTVEIVEPNTSAPASGFRGLRLASAFVPYEGAPSNSLTLEIDTSATTTGWGPVGLLATTASSAPTSWEQHNTNPIVESRTIPVPSGAAEGDRVLMFVYWEFPASIGVTFPGGEEPRAEGLMSLTHPDTGATRRVRAYTKTLTAGDVAGGDISIEITSAGPSSDEWDVGDVVSDICLEAGLPGEGVDISDIGERTLAGVPLSPENPAADTLTSICELLQIDVVNAGGTLTFRARGGPSVADISGVDAVDDGGPVHEAKRRDRIEIPRQLILEYYDVDGGLNADTQLSTRALDSRAISEVKRKTSVLMTAEEAVERAHIAHKVLIEEQRGEWEFSLPDSYLYLTVGDVVTFEGHRLRITETEIDEGLQSYKAVHDRASAYASDAVPSPPGDPTDPPSLVVGQTVLHFIDSHILRDADDRLGYYVAITGVGDAWQGALVELSTDGGETYPDSIEAGTDAIVGELTETLPAHSRYYPDTVNTLSVELIRDDMALESATLAQMMNRRNLAIVGDEIINFGDVEEDSQGHWTLSNLLRGRKGSPIETHPAETRFVLLERQQLWFIDADTTLLGQELTLRVTSLGSDASATQTVTFTGQSQQERQPAYLTAERDGGDVVVDWQGVGRLGGGTHVAMGSFFQHYRVTVNGTDYTTTDQQLTVTDPGGALTIEVRQVNSLTGAGPAAQVTI